MIFVTVGTHEQAFNRLVEAMDKLAQSGEIQEEVIIQKGYSTYEPKFCQAKDLIGYDEMSQYIQSARIVITHGGPASFIMPLQTGKIPVVVPRQKKFKEHVNDHQLEFCREVARRQKNIIVVEDIAFLGEILKNYDELCKNLNGSSSSNNDRFIEEFKKIVNDLMG